MFCLSFLKRNRVFFVAGRTVDSLRIHYFQSNPGVPASIRHPATLLPHVTQREGMARAAYGSRSRWTRRRGGEMAGFVSANCTREDRNGMALTLIDNSRLMKWELLGRQ